jgi:hypothetical protein
MQPGRMQIGILEQRAQAAAVSFRQSFLEANPLNPPCFFFVVCWFLGRRGTLQSIKLY